ncbi:MAG: hypothetical protein IJ518_06300 [Clostridia bacterium]|nr:hypothetical protein [Clostridia bacterium]
MLALILSVLVVPMSVSAAQTLVIEDDFASCDTDTPASLLKRLYNLESGENVRIKYSFGKGYCCADGGGKTASLVYKVDAKGGKFDSLGITVKGHFASRDGYNPDWTKTPSGTVEVSFDGTTFYKVKTWEGERVDMATYGDANAYKDLPVKTYTADLTSAAGDDSVVYVRLAWDVFDVPMFSSVLNVKIEGNVTGGSGLVETPTTTTTVAPTTTTTEAATTTEATTTTATEAVQTTTTTVADVNNNNSDVDVDTDTDADGDSEPAGAPIVLIVVIVAVLILAAAGAIVFLLFKKGAKK